MTGEGPLQDLAPVLFALGLAAHEAPPSQDGGGAAAGVVHAAHDAAVVVLVRVLALARVRPRQGERTTKDLRGQRQLLQALLTCTKSGTIQACAEIRPLSEVARKNIVIKSILKDVP